VFRKNYKYLIFHFLFFIFYFSWVLPLWADYVPNELVVRFKPDVIRLPKGVSVASVKAAEVRASSVRALSEKYGVTKYEQIYAKALEIMPSWKHLADDYLLTFTTGEVLSAVEDFRKDPNVLYASPNYVVRAFLLPNDPGLSKQWGLFTIEATRAWDKTVGSATFEIAVLDTGIDYDHEDFVGKVDTKNAWNFTVSPGNSNARDDYGHGTEVSGVIAAVTDNGKGIAGMDWRAKILPIKVLNNEGKGSFAEISAGLAYVTSLKATWEETGGSSGVNVVAINMSLGDYTFDSTCQTRCQEAYNHDIVLVAAAGNDGVETPTYPAYYSTVMAVAATDPNDKRSVWPLVGKSSNYGTWIDVCAPGSGIYSTDMSGGYSYSDGTSLAAPFVTGLAALLKASNGSLTNAMIVNRIKESTDNIDALNPGFEGKLGTGRINAFLALLGLSAQITSPESGAFVKGKINIYGTASGWAFAGYTLEAVSGSTKIPLVSSTSSVESGLLGSWETTNYNGNYELVLRSYSSNGATAESRVPITVDNVSPEANISDPTSESSRAGKFNIIGTAKDLNFDHYVLQYKSATSTNFETIGTYYLPVENGVLGTWETSGLKGRYYLRLQAWDKAGNTSEDLIALNIIEAAPTKELQPQTGNLPLTYALPNPFVRSQTSEVSFVYNLEGNFNAVIYLFDINGNLIWQKSYQAGENGGKSGPNNPSWNGENLFGERVPNGVYLYQIVADRRVIGRGKIIVLN